MSSSAVDSILDYFDTASAAEVAEGVAWYQQAALNALALAERHGVEFETAACVVAALSPRMQWSRTMQLADQVTEAFRRDPEPAELPRFPGVLGASVQRAWNVLASTDGPLAALRSDKVRCFA